jgi:tRNA threonylcarbamoyl adenosine modification protein YeaZ
MSEPVLVLDTGSPLVSVALGRGGEVVAQRSVEQGRSSARLLALVGEVLAEAGIEPRGLGRVAALQGPGSFTGLRIGLATVLGLHQALGVPATALPTLAVIAGFAGSVSREPGETVIAAVDALRGEWSAQAFAAGPLPRPLTDLELVPGGELPRLAGDGPGVVVGFGVPRLADLPGWPARLRLIEPGPLAPAAVRLAAAPDLAWDPALLIQPVYSRPPAVTPMKPREARA